MQVLKFCLPKESISEQLDSGYIDTRQRKESNKISGNQTGLTNIVLLSRR